MNFFADLCTLIYPPQCELCGINELTLCIRCSHRLSTSAHSLRGFTHPVTAGIIYDSDTSAIVLRAKENGSQTAYHALALALASALIHLNPPRQFSLVPIPSTPRSIRRRGRNFIMELSHIFVKNLHNTYAIEIVDVLLHQKKVRDQSGLSMRDREANMVGSLIQQRTITTPVVILDDVITTGSTMKAAFCALDVAQTTIIGGIAACASPRQMRIR